MVDEQTVGLYRHLKYINYISTIYQDARIFHASVLCTLAGLMQYTHIVGDITYLVGQEAIFKR